MWQNRHEEAQKRMQALPDIFYRYTLDLLDGIIVIPINKKKYSGNYLMFEYELPDTKGIMRTFGLSEPDTVRFGIFDGRRKCVFFKEPDRERDAALIFDAVYEEQVAKYEAKIRKAILKRKALQQVIKKGEGDGQGLQM